MKRLSLILLFLIAFVTLKAQNVPFFNEIQNFKKQDSISFPPKKAILLIGSSTFTNWKDVQSYFPDKKIINRGFGGSSLPDVINHIGNVVYPYHPKQVVIYCGENDFMAAGTTPQMVLERAKNLISLIRAKYPKVPIAYISIKPSPSRAKYIPQMKEANAMIASLISKTKRATYINTADAMYNPDGTIMQDIFLKDDLHMNAKGYAIWKKVMEPYLK